MKTACPEEGRLPGVCAEINALRVQLQLSMLALSGHSHLASIYVIIAIKRPPRQ